MSEIITKLAEGAKQLNLDLSAGQLEQIETYLSLLQKWNRVFNLTAIRKPMDMLSHHILDSLAMGRFFKAEGRYLDVGTGAGLPGLILAILLPEAHFTLLDSNSKKTSFVKQTAHHLGLSKVSVVTCRIEAFNPPELFDIVTSRAFSALPDFVNLCQRFVKPKGFLLAMKGPKVVGELKEFAYDYHLEKINVPFLVEERYGVMIPQR